MNFPITEIELIQKMRGEDSFTQYKKEINNAESLAEEMVAFANSDGGYILVGIDEDKQGKGVAFGISNIKNLNNHISNASSENCVPAIFPKTQSLIIENKDVVIIYIEKGKQCPYRTKSGKYLMRAGADKRAVSQEELSRMLQASGSFHVEELPVRGANVETALDMIKLAQFFEKTYNGVSITSQLEENKQSLATLLNNLGIANESELNLVGLMFFGKTPQRFRPLLEIKAVSFYGNDITDTQYLANDDFGGTLDTQFEMAVNFVVKNLLKKQPQGQGYNSIGQLEISTIAIEEAIANALVHRDYSKLGSIKIFIFQDRVEILSPGAMPNHLTIEQIKNGNAVPRNPILLGYATKLMPYKGTGTGIRRMIHEHPRTELFNDREGQQFKVVFWR